jgi:hypothetical protein
LVLRSNDTARRRPYAAKLRRKIRIIVTID